MDRRNFITYASILGGSAALKSCAAFTPAIKTGKKGRNTGSREMNADVIIVSFALFCTINSPG
jgi:hypothetical protein